MYYIEIEVQYNPLIYFACVRKNLKMHIEKAIFIRIFPRERSHKSQLVSVYTIYEIYLKLFSFLQVISQRVACIEY